MAYLTAPHGHAGLPEPLEHQEEDDQRHHGHQRSDDGQEVVLWVPLGERGGVPDVQPEVDREEVLVGQHHQGKEEAVPDLGELEEEDGHEARRDHRQADPAEGPELSRPVHPGCLQDLVGDVRGAEDAGQVHPEREHEAGDEHAPEGVHQTRFGSEQVERDRHRRSGHHHAQQDEGEEPLLAGEVQFVERVPGGHAEHGRQQRADTGVQDRVEQPAQEDPVVDLEQVLEVVDEREVLARGEAVGGEEVLAALGGREEQPEHRQKRVEGGETEHGGHTGSGQQDRWTVPGATPPRPTPVRPALLRPVPACPVRSRTGAVGGNACHGLGHGLLLLREKRVTRNDSSAANSAMSSEAAAASPKSLWVKAAVWTNMLGVQLLPMELEAL